MKSVRVWFSKKGRAVYISHLDMMRCMQRALKRAGIPVWYTQGFNPHIYLTFALPLSLGYAGACETMDIRLNEDMPFDEIVTRLNSALPPDIRVLRVAEPINKPEAIAYADYTVTIPSNDAGVLLSKWISFISQPVIASDKKTKKGYKEVNLKDYIINTDANIEGNTLVISMRLRAGINENLNPSLVIEAFRKACDVEFANTLVRRTAILDHQLQPFE